MSTFAVLNDEMDVGMINLQFPRLSSQASYANITTVTTPQVLPLDSVFVFCAGATGTAGSTTINLVLPPPLIGKNLFIVNRSTNSIVNSQNSASTDVSVIVDIENDPNVATPATQNTILAATAGAWVHLVGNGRNWVAVAKSLVAPTPA